VDGIESEQDVVVLDTGLIMGAEGGVRGRGLVTAITFNSSISTAMG
jgi:hypothetical protein